MEEQKTLKMYAKEAKKRMKSGFWQSYKDNLKEELKKAEDAGVSPNKVREYYTNIVSDTIKNEKKEQEDFYIKVKRILDEEGEISNAIGRLTEKEVYDKLSYEEKQRYTLSLSEKYLLAVERYKKEKAIKF